MKKSAILLSMLGLFLVGCSENNNNAIVPSDSSTQYNDGSNQNDNNNQNNSNNGNQESNNNETQEDEIDYHIETVCFHTEESLNMSSYFDIANETQKDITTENELETIYYRVAVGKDNNLVSFVEGERLQNVNFDKSKIILFPIIHNGTASYFTFNWYYQSKNTDEIDIDLKENIEVENDSTYYTVGFVYVIVPKGENYTINVSYAQSGSGSTISFKKPIIYFYPEKEMDLSVEFVNKEKLLTTYPKYNNGWNIHLNEDGTFVTGNDNREYYAIYFDEIANYTCNFEEGFYVNKDNAINFLEEKMDYIGYTNREVNEFVMYWLPILEQNEHSLVYFEQTEERNKECPLIFSTEPNTLIRTMIHIKKVDGEQTIKEQELVHYDRNGFVVTEWGGAEY